VKHCSQVSFTGACAAADTAPSSCTQVAFSPG
jgi:hypothetical protein